MPINQLKAGAILNYIILALNAIIGFVLIFILILALNLMMPQMVNWVNQNDKNQTEDLITGFDAEE